MNEHAKDNLTQFINETIATTKYLNAEIELIKNSPVIQMQKALLENGLGDNKKIPTESLNSTNKAPIKQNKSPSHERKNGLTEVIKKAQSEAKQNDLDPLNTGVIYSILHKWANDEHPPFLAATEDGLKYIGSKKDNYLTFNKLRLRLQRKKIIKVETFVSDR